MNQNLVFFVFVVVLFFVLIILALYLNKEDFVLQALETVILFGSGAVSGATYMRFKKSKKTQMMGDHTNHEKNTRS